MRKAVPALFIFISGITTCLAQNRLTDSLKIELAAAKTDSARVLLTAELGLQYRNTNPDSSIYFGRQAIRQAREIGFKKGEALAMTNTGLALREKGDLPGSLDLELRALRMAREGGYDFVTGFCLRRIGLVYMDLKDYNTSLAYFHQALDQHLALKSARGINIEYTNIGMTFEYLDNLDSAMYYIRKAEMGKASIVDIFPEVNRVLGNIYAKKGDQVNALLYYNKGIDAGKALNDYRTISFICADAARMFKGSNQRDSIIHYARMGVEYGQRASYKKGILFSGTLLSELYDPENPQEALRYYKLAGEARDSLFGAWNMQTVQNLIAQETARQKEIQVAQEEYNDKLTRYALLAGLCIILVVALILFLNNRQKQKTNKQLRSQKMEIENALTDLKAAQAQLVQSEKMASLGELTAGIAHEIQNPLNFVNNFSEVSRELLDEMDEELAAGNIETARAISKDVIANMEKITQHGKRADSIVKGMLQHSRMGSGLKELTDLNALADEYLRLCYHGIRAKDPSFNSSLNIETDPAVGMVNVILQDMGRVILNLLTNAFYAVNDRKKSNPGFEPMVSVTTKREGGKVMVSIKDNGNGIPQKLVDKIYQPFFTTKPTGEGTGLGLSLSYDIVTKGHGGELKLDTAEGRGTEFVIVLPG